MSSPPAKRFDVLGLGCTAVDDLLYVPSAPPPDSKVRIERTARQCGGLTGTALVTAAHLGARCAFAGCLGTDEFSQYVASHFTREGVDVSHAPRMAEAAVVHSVIVVARNTGSRTIYYQVPGVMGAHDSLPPDDVIRDTKVLFIDHYGMSGNLRASRLARAAGASVVADFEDDPSPLFGEVMALVDHLILSEGFALRLTRAPNAADAAMSLWQASRAVVIVTCGKDGCWSVSTGAPTAARHHPAFRIQAVDTTGCGDVFHGAYAAALAWEYPLERRIRFAAAAAALKAATCEIPRRIEVEQLMARP